MLKSIYGITDSINPLTPSNPYVPELLSQFNAEQASIWYARDVEDLFSYNGFARVTRSVWALLSVTKLETVFEAYAREKELLRSLGRSSRDETAVYC